MIFVKDISANRRYFQYASQWARNEEPTSNNRKDAFTFLIDEIYEKIKSRNVQK